MSESQSQPMLMIRGLGGLRTQAIQTAQQALDEKLKRCELELTSVLKLDEEVDVFEVDISRLRSMFLDKNPVFKDLVDQLRIWNSDVRALKQKGKPIIRSNYRYQLAQNLVSNLREVVNTRDREIQQFYLMQLRAWYYNQSNSKTRPSTQQHNQMKSMDSNSNFLLTQQTGEFDGGAPFEFNQVDLTDYFSNRRSKHTHLEPPQDRIREFTKKELDFRDGVSSSQGTRPGTVAFSQTRPHTQGSFARPSTNHQSMRGTGMLSNFDAASSRGASRGGMTTAQSQFRAGDHMHSIGGGASAAPATWEKEREKLRSPGMLPTTAATTTISPWNYTGSLAFFQQNPAGAAVGARQQQFQSIKFKDSNENIGADGEENEEGEEAAATPAGAATQSKLQSNEISVNNGLTKSTGNLLFPPERKIYNSDANTIQSYASSVRANSKTHAKSTFLNYVPSNNLGEIRLENLWHTNRNRAVKEKREHEELQTHMKAWSHNKGIFDQEINQKNQLTSHGSNFQDIGLKKPPSNGAAPELSDKNYMEKEKTTEEIEVSEMMNNYLTMLRKPVAEKEAIGTNHKGSDESVFEIAAKIDQSIRSPRSGRSSRSSPRHNANDFSQELNNSIDRQSQLNQQDGNSKKAKNAADKSNEANAIEVPELPQRPKTTYVNMRSDIRVGAAPESEFIDLEAKIKREKFIKLKEAKGKIVGLSSSSIGGFGTSNSVSAHAGSKQHSSNVAEDVDDEEVQRRKEHSLQMHHRRQEYGLGDSKVNGEKPKHKFRPFTSLYKRISLESLRNDQMNEIQSVRKNFAKKGIKCSLNTITQSLSRFEGLPAASLTLPSPGSMLFTNPFDNFGKKKSSKKKK